MAAADSVHPEDATVKGLHHFIRRCRILTGVSYATMVEYRAEIFLWAVSMALPLIVMGVWIKAGTASPDRFVMGPTEFARYFLAVFLVRNLSVVWVIHDFENQVVSGRLSAMLLQPLDPGWRFVSAHIGEQAARIPFALILMGLAALAFPDAIFGVRESDATPAQPAIGPWLPNLTHMLMALVAIYAAFALRFLLQYAVAMLSFWIERVEKLDALIFLPYLYLSGTLAPLQEFDPALRDAILWTPFPYMVWYPAMLLVDGNAPGLPSPFFAAGVIAMWIVIFHLVGRLIWRKGLAHYSAMGA